MTQLVRWGSSSYERSEGFALEAARVEALGIRYRVEPQGAPATAIADADVVVVTTLTRVGAADLDQAPGCRLVVTTTSGYDHIDLDAARARGVAVARLADARRDAVAETAVAMGMSMMRGLPALQDAARRGSWARAELPELGISLLADEPVGLVGLGVIGRRVATMLRVLGAEVLGNDPAGLPEGVRAVDLPTMLRRCRLVSLHCSLAPGAPPVLDAGLLRRARPDLLLVNTARGGVLDLTAALSLLEAGLLGGLALDVFPREPWPGLGALAQHPRVLLSPHAAGYHPRLHASIATELEAVLRAWTTGEPLPGRVA
jgi:phosphoglycerate dehydrogenase-like enzyme